MAFSKSYVNSGGRRVLRSARNVIILMQKYASLRSLRTLRSVPSRRSGFTLLELLIVLLLITLMITFSAALFTNTLSSSKLNAFAREMSATIRHARTLAQIHGLPQTVTIDLDARQYGVEGRVVKRIPPNIDVRIVDPFEGDIYTGTYRIVAGTSGTVSGGTIVLWNKKSAVTIRLDPIVGVVVMK
jgi:prepilin-type N-terminal cleavage/methylation domain-containing protein